MSSGSVGTNRMPKLARRRQILDAATALFSQCGFPDTTMDDIASRAAITKRTLYRYFETKEQLLYAIHDEFAGYHLDHPTSGDNAAEILSEAIRRHVEIVTSESAKVAVFFECRKYLTPSLQAELHTRRARYEDGVRLGVAAGQKQGEVRSALNPSIATKLLLGSVAESYRWFQSDGSLAPATITEIASTIVLHGLAEGMPLRGDEDIATEVADAITTSRALESEVSDGDALGALRTVAVASFAQEGYRPSSIQVLAERANLTTGAVMYHAGYKHRLLETTAIEFLESGVELIDRADDPTKSPAARVARILGALVAYATSRPAEFAVAAENLHYLQPEPRRTVEVLWSRWNSALDLPLHAGIAPSAFDATKARVLASLIMGFTNSPYRWYRLDGSLSPSEIATAAAELVVRGVLTK